MMNDHTFWLVFLGLGFALGLSLMVLFIFNKLAPFFFFWYSGGSGALGAGLNKFSTVAAIEEPIKPPLKVEHTQLLIDGKFVDAATG